jgi:hypothetical protein
MGMGMGMGMHEIDERESLSLVVCGVTERLDTMALGH